MSIPDDRAIVQRVHTDHPHLIATNSKDTVREFYWRAAWALHQHDPNWGMLTKSAGENHQTIEGLRVSVDAIAYKGETPIVDILSSAGDGPGTGGVVWGVDPHRRESNLWIAPPQFKTAGGGVALTPGTGTGTGTGSSSEIEKLRELVQTLRNDMTTLQGRLSALENGTLRYGAPVGLRTNAGHVFCAEGGGGREVNASRRDVGPWETFVLEKP